MSSLITRLRSGMPREAREHSSGPTAQLHDEITAANTMGEAADEIEKLRELERICHQEYDEQNADAYLPQAIIAMFDKESETPDE